MNQKCQFSSFIEQYFNEQMSVWNMINRVAIDPAHRNYHKKFSEELDKLIDSTKIERQIQQISNALDKQLLD